MAGAFQRLAFQRIAFQQVAATPPSGIGVTGATRGTRVVGAAVDGRPVGRTRLPRR